MQNLAKKKTNTTPLYFAGPETAQKKEEMLD